LGNVAWSFPQHKPEACLFTSKRSNCFGAYLIPNFLMKPRKTIVITEKYDLTADAVILKLRDMGQLPVRVNLEDMPSETNFSLHLDNTGIGGKLLTRNREIDLVDIRSVFWRKPKRELLSGATIAEGLAFARHETHHALNGLYSVLDCYWMNFPKAVYEASWKTGQLRRAVELSFEIPRTLVTSHPEEVIPFYEQCGQKMLFKVMGNQTVAPDDTAPPTNSDIIRAIPPTIVDKGHLDNHLAEVANTPCLFQEFIEKKKEFQVIIVGDDIFVAEIESSARLRAPLDRSRKNPEVSLRKASVPAHIEAGCFAYAKSYGLNIVAIDLVLTAEGRFVFVGSNCSGDWLLLQECIPELKIVDAVAACLLRSNFETSRASSQRSDARPSINQAGS
jgi:glutathione synthase/RimK-type ligase-like ATP-grasp enzyme